MGNYLVLLHILTQPIYKLIVPRAVKLKQRYMHYGHAKIIPEHAIDWYGRFAKIISLINHKLYYRKILFHTSTYMSLCKLGELGV